MKTRNCQNSHPIKISNIPKHRNAEYLSGFVNRWMKADTTKTGKRLFRRDVAQQTVVQALEATAAALHSEPQCESYQELVDATSFD